MRSHISVHRATTKYFSNLFVFRTKIEKEGLPKGSPAGLGAGGPEFESRRPDQFIYLPTPSNAGFGCHLHYAFLPRRLPDSATAI
jgi:hypothetical protein